MHVSCCLCRSCSLDHCNREVYFVGTCLLNYPQYQYTCFSYERNGGLLDRHDISVYICSYLSGESFIQKMVAAQQENIFPT
jgi:hypothetical protein